MAAELVWLDGAFVPADDASVSVFDRGLTVGHGVFETLKAVDGVAFALTRHLERLRTSVGALDLDVRWTDDDLRGAIAGVLGSAPRPLARVRITVTGGVAPLGPDPGDATPSVVVAAGALEAAAPSATVCTVPWPKNERGAMAGVKTTSGAESVRAMAHARARGCTEALFGTTTGLLSEGAASNVFVVHDGLVRTPSLSAGCLAGVTRALVLELVDVDESPIAMTDLATADEVFLTSTTRDVQPVAHLDDRELPAPGPVTAKVMEAFAAVAAADPDP
jgi:branched-chain amino acid aminotransferase